MIALIWVCDALTGLVIILYCCNPGRWPGLICFAPLGRKFICASIQNGLAYHHCLTDNSTHSFFDSVVDADNKFYFRLSVAEVLPERQEHTSPG